MGGERGIRTLDTVLPYTRSPGVLLKPLGHLPKIELQNYNIYSQLQNLFSKKLFGNF